MIQEDIDKLIDSIGFGDIELVDENFSECRRFIYNNYEYRFLKCFFDANKKEYSILKRYKLIDNRQKDNDFKGDMIFFHPSTKYEKISNDVKKEFIHILRKKKIEGLL